MCDLFANSSVLDLGCGTGQYGTHFSSACAHKHISWVGLDGGERVNELTHGHVRFADLANGLPRDVRARAWDWVMSIEVGEHVPRSGEPVFMHSLLAQGAAPRGIVLSWAVLGQEGNHHVNCQTNAYIQCAMGLLGFEFDEATSSRLRAGTNPQPCGWLYNTLMAFRPKADTPALPNVYPLPPTPTQIYQEAYLTATAAMCPYTPNGCDPSYRPTGGRHDS